MSFLLLILSGNLEMPRKGQYYSFSCMRYYIVENLPELFRTRMKKNKESHKKNKSRGLVITNGLKIFLLVTPNEDTFLVLRLGYSHGFYICNLFGLGDPDTLEEAVAENTRD